MSKGQDPNNNPLGGFNKLMAAAIVSQMEAFAAGKFGELVKARSMRIELPLANGNADVIDLNPQDQAFAAIVRQCAADLLIGQGGGAPPQKQAAAEEPPRQPPTPRSSTSVSQPPPLQLPVGRREWSGPPWKSVYRDWCPPGHKMIVKFWSEIRGLDEYDPHRKAAKVPVYEIGPARLVRVADDGEVRLPAGAKVPDYRCVVIRELLDGTSIVGTMDYSALHQTSANFTEQ
jgi:hypothetical protein